MCVRGPANSVYCRFCSVLCSRAGCAGLERCELRFHPLRGCAGATPPTHPLKRLRLMELWAPVRHLLTNSNPNRPATCRTLHCRQHPSLLICRAYVPERTIRLANPKPPRKRSLIFLHLCPPTHRTRTLPWLLPLQGNLKYRSHPPTDPHGHSLRRIRPALRSHSHYQSVLSCSLHRPNPRRMSLRWILSR